jgi:phosphoribosylformylglycinamidine synthase
MVSPDDLRLIHETLKREPTETELACFENLWSEHCSYRSTRRLLGTLPTTGPDVIVGPGDDAAIVRFNDDIALAIGMESHNHPSYVDPVNGAATGVGGIVRDIISMGARPIALMDPLCFGDPVQKKNHYLLEHVVLGIGGYGNCIGVPVVRGDLIIDAGYDGNPLVNVVCVGICKPDKFITGRVKEPGNHLLLLGAPTGRDGIGGASFASKDLAESSGEERPSVQIGDPFTEKLLIEATLAMIERGLVVSCRDLGAAGLAGASSEMCSTLGGHIYVDKVHLREVGMTPREIMVSESQERMLLEVRPADIEQAMVLAERYDLICSDVGQVIAEPRYLVTYEEQTICDLDIHFLTEGAPKCIWNSTPYSALKPYVAPKGSLKELCLNVLSHPECASKQWLYEQYDHDVQTRTISFGRDAGLLKLGTDSMLGLSCGCNPRQIMLDPYTGTANAVYENAANLACMGVEPLCIVNCLNFASPEHPEIYWQIEQCIRGMGDMCQKLSIPVVGGNVSLYNESDETKTQIPPTPSIGMIGRAPIIVPQKVKDGDHIYLCSSRSSAQEEKKEGDGMGGSILSALTGCQGTPPTCTETEILTSIRDAAKSEAVVITDISQGGLITALATMAHNATITMPDGIDPVSFLFTESYGRFLIFGADKTVIETALKTCALTELGAVGGEGLIIRCKSEEVRLLPEEIKQARESLTDLMRPA